MSSARIKSFQRALARYGLFSSSWLFAHLPFRIVRILTHILITIGFCFTIKQRRISEESLNIAFGETKDAQEIKRITKACFANFGQGMIEMLYSLSHPQFVQKNVTIKGKTHLDKALAQGRGVIAVTAHFGNFPLMMLACAARGYTVNTIIRPARDKDLEKYLLNKRAAVGVKTVYAIPRKTCVTNSLKALRNNEILFIPLDQNFGSSGGVFVDFFGQKAATATGPVVFAKRTGAVILPMFIVRQKDNKHKIIIEPPMDIEEHEDEQETLVATTSKITHLIEQYIRRYPHEWGWMHRRWKSRPSR